LFRRRVPRDLVDLVGQSTIKIALGTDSLIVARQRVGAVNADCEAHWKALRLADGDEAANAVRARFAAAQAQARRFGFDYRSVDDLATGPLEDLLARVEVAGGAGAAEPRGRALAAGLLGGVPRPPLTWAAAFKLFEEATATDRTGFGPDQLRRWRNPRLLAIRNFEAVAGSVALAEITRSQALDFRAWWIDRILDEDMTGEAANKSFGFLSAMFRTVNDLQRLGLDNPFTGLSVKLRQGDERLPFDTDWIANTLLAPGTLSGLNDEARWVLFIKAETGARTREICGLDPDGPGGGDIRIDADVPHIVIQPNQFRGLKNAHTRRSIPLVGAALSAAKAMPGGTGRYRTGADSLSATVNKFLRENNLLATPQHSFNSLRHSFEDRLTAVEALEKVQAALMGHRYARPRYGAGPSLAQKQALLRRIAFKGVEFY
jgi:hypothetical protein